MVLYIFININVYILNTVGFFFFSRRKTSDCKFSTFKLYKNVKWEKTVRSHFIFSVLCAYSVNFTNTTQIRELDLM